MEPTAKLDRLRVLIVEDNPHMVLIVKTILRGLGIKDLIDARGTGAAWERLNSEAIDVLILDRVLDGQDGLELARRIRTEAHSPNPYLPIIMLSAHSERTRVEEARDAGITEFCCKPVTAKDLYTKLAMVIDRPRPFVRTGAFFGPDRRRHTQENYGGEERREAEDGDEARQNAA